MRPGLARDGSTFGWRGITTATSLNGTEPLGPERYQQTLVFDTGGRGDLPATFALRLALNLRVGDGQTFVDSPTPRLSDPPNRNLPLTQEIRLLAASDLAK